MSWGGRLLLSSPGTVPGRDGFFFFFFLVLEPSDFFLLELPVVFTFFLTRLFLVGVLRSSS